MVTDKNGFTLIELSIVLVIIGLVVGGVLVGRDLIESAAARGQVSQIQEYNSAVNAFKMKYGYMPGDMPEPDRTSVSMTFTPNNSTKCVSPNGDGIINTFKDSMQIRTSVFFESQYCGEYTLIWADLARAGLIGGNFPNNNTYVAQGSYTVAVTGDTINKYVPKSKLGDGYNVYVYSGGLNDNIQGWWLGGVAGNDRDGKNYFALARFTSFNEYLLGTDTHSIAVDEAYKIDVKVDDGLPALGNVRAGGPAFTGAATAVVYAASGATGSASTCLHGSTQQNAVYSVSAAGATKNCILSFRMQ